MKLTRSDSLDLGLIGVIAQADAVNKNSDSLVLTDRTDRETL